jgi:hypothetical protein
MSLTHRLACAVARFHCRRQIKLIEWAIREHERTVRALPDEIVRLHGLRLYYRTLLDELSPPLRPNMSALLSPSVRRR